METAQLILPVAQREDPAPGPQSDHWDTEMCGEWNYKRIEQEHTTWVEGLPLDKSWGRLCGGEEKTSRGWLITPG